MVVGVALLVLLTMDAAPRTPVVPLPPPPDGSAEVPPDVVTPPLAHPYFRTAAEVFLLLGVQTAWYWRHPAYSSWELHFTWNDWHAKLFSMRTVVFDDDMIVTNGIAHPLAGTLSYQIARGNGLSPLASFVTSVIASTVWEYFSEWDERPSTNDLIFTPAGGAVIGEATYRLGRMFAAGSPGVGNCLGALLFSPVATLNETPVCRDTQAHQTDAFGLPSRTWHRLAFNLGEGWSSIDGSPLVTAVDLGFLGTIVDHPRYLRPGSGLSPVSPGEWTDFAFGTLANRDGIQGLEVHAAAAWWGRYLRDFATADGSAARGTDGWGLMLGLGSTFDYDARNLFVMWDRVVTAGLAGPTLEYADRHGSLTTRAMLTAQYGFSMVTSLAYPAAASSLANQTIKTELKEQGYYYAQSVTGAATLMVEDEPLTLFLRARFGAFWSFNHDDRDQAKITDNFSLHDRRLYLRAGAELRVLGGPLRLVLAFDQINRESQLPDYTYGGVERRATVSALTRF
ncbi:MAG TPA: DUF3943 domain-containing protein [Polyangia bacterium]|nr:DUF3943 domain-containing protein [Polyangia bacterium]